MLIYRNEFQDAIEHLQLTLMPEDSETPRFTYALAAAYSRAAIDQWPEIRARGTGEGGSPTTDRIACADRAVFENAQ